MDMGSFTVSIIGPNPDDLDDAARSLRSDLQEVSGITISPVQSDEQAVGTRSAVYVDVVGSLAVLYYGGKMTGIARILHTWLDRNKEKSVKVKRGDTEVEVKGMSEKGILDILTKVGNGGGDPSDHEEVS